MEKRYNQKFVYTELAKPSLGHTEPYNIFGVIIDATYPYSKVSKNSFGDQKNVKARWIVNIKIIDVSLN